MVLGILLLFCLALQRVVMPDVPVAPEVILLAQLVWYLWLRPALVRTLAAHVQFYVSFETDNFRYHSLAPSHVPLCHMTPPDPL